MTQHSNCAKLCFAGPTAWSTIPDGGTGAAGQGLLSLLAEDVGTTLLPLLNAGKGCTDHPACCVWTLLAQNLHTHARSLSLSEGSTNTRAPSPLKKHIGST